MTKTNAQTAVKTRAAKGKPAATPVNKDAIVQSSGTGNGSSHFIKSVGGQIHTFPTELWAGKVRAACGIGKSFKEAKALVEAIPQDKPKSQLARGIGAADARHSAKSVADQNRGAKPANKADAATQKAPKAPKAKTDKVADKAAKLAELDKRKITFVAPNPKRPGSDSFDRYANYKKGMAVAQALAAGVTRADIDWDSKRDFIKFA